jgi:hypothetical protein
MGIRIPNTGSLEPESRESADPDPNPHQRYDINLVEYDAWIRDLRGSADLDPNPHQRYDIHLVEYDAWIRNPLGLWIWIRIQKAKRIPEKGKNMRGMENNQDI